MSVTFDLTLGDNEAHEQYVMNMSDDDYAVYFEARKRGMSADDAILVVKGGSL
jgi:hypothetical protein